MAEYRIDGYGLYLGAGIIPHSDKSTANSFEKPADIVDVYSHIWEDGVVEYDLDAPVALAPRLFVIKGYLTADNLIDYNAGRQAILDLIYQNYVTLEQVESGVKANARLRKGVAAWNRLTNLDGKIIVEVEFQFDEVLQDVPFKDSETDELVYLTDAEGNLLQTQKNQNYID